MNLRTLNVLAVAPEPSPGLGGRTDVASGNFNGACGVVVAREVRDANGGVGTQMPGPGSIPGARLSINGTPVQAPFDSAGRLGVGSSLYGGSTPPVPPNRINSGPAIGVALTLAAALLFYGSAIAIALKFFLPQ